MTPKVAPVVTVAVWFSVIRLLAAKTRATPPVIAKANGITKRLAIFKSLPDTLGYRRVFKLKNIQNHSQIRPDCLQSGIDRYPCWTEDTTNYSSWVPDFLQLLNAGL